MDGTDDRRTILVIAVALVSFVVVAAAGTAGFVIGARTPKLDSQSESANLRGGAIVVSGVSRNTGAGVAQNVVIQVAVDLGGGLNIDVGSSTAAATGEGVGSANLGDIAAGMDRPYSVSIPIGDRSAATDLKYLAEPRWDKPSLDTADLSFSVSYSGSHVIDHVTGKVKNAGKGPAPNASITFSESADKAGNSLLGEATSKLGDVAAGADLPFQLAVDLGANPPNDLYYSSTFTFDAAKVADEQETAKRVGGTLTLTGFLRNSGAVPAASLVLSGSLLDAAGLKLASGAARVGSLPPGARAPYTLTMDLGQSSPKDIKWVDVTVAWQQTRFFLFRESKSQSTKEAVPTS